MSTVSIGISYRQTTTYSSIKSQIHNHSYIISTETKKKKDYIISKTIIVSDLA